MIPKSAGTIPNTPVLIPKATEKKNPEIFTYFLKKKYTQRIR